MIGWWNYLPTDHIKRFKLMATYSYAIPYTLDFEGGLSDDPFDRGGITKYGVSLVFAKGTKNLKLFDKDGDGDIDRNDIKELSIDDAKEAFKLYFWDPVDLDDITSEKKAFVIFDSNVNHGLGNSIPMLQRTCVKLGMNISIDGIFGPNTKNAFELADEDLFCDEFLDVRKNFYYKIVQRNPSQKKFLKGWLNRINGIKNILKTYPN